MRWCGVGGIGESYEVVWCWGHRGVVLLNGL